MNDKLYHPTCRMEQITGCEGYGLYVKYEELQKVKQERNEAVELLRDAIPAFLVTSKSHEWEKKKETFLNKIGNDDV